MMTYTRFLRFPASFLILLLAWVPNVQAIPILDQLASAGSSPDFLRIEIAGRDHASAFSGVNQMIASGRGQDLVSQATRVLTSDANADLAYEVRGVGYLMLRDLENAISDFENASRLAPTQSGPIAKLGLALMESDQLEAAEQALRLALQTEASDGFAQRNLGLLYDNLGRSDEAIPLLLQGIGDSNVGYEFEAKVVAGLLNERRLYSLAIAVLAPRIPLSHVDAAAHALLATAMLAEQQWQDALDRFNRALILEPSSTVNQLGRAVALRGAGRIDQSIEQLQELQSSPDVGRQVAVELTLSQFAAGQQEAAVQTRREAVAMGANPVSLDLSIAQMYVDLQMFEEAQASYESLLERDAANAQAYVNLSELYFAAGRIDDAHALLQSGKQQYPNNPFLLFRLGNSYASVGEYDPAVVELNSANALAPNNPEILRSLTLVQTRLGNFDEAVFSAENLQQMYPNDLDTLVFVALAYERAGDTAKAIDVYQQVLSIQSENVLVLNNLANLLAQNGEYARALTLIEQAAENVPENPVVLDTLGFVRLRLGEYQEALAIFDQAIALVPELAIAHYHRGLALVQLDRGSDSQQAFEQALALSPEASWAEDAQQQLSRL